MLKRVWFTVAAIAVIACSAGWAAPAAAHEGDDVWIAPGIFEAEGDGIAAAAGSLNLRLCAADGLLLTKGEAAVPADGYDQTAEWLGLQAYFGFHGCVEFEGHSASGLVAGQGLTLRAEGVGVAYLEGEGEWTQNQVDAGPWPAAGDSFRIGSKWLDPTPEADSADEPGPTATPQEDGEM